MEKNYKAIQYKIITHHEAVVDKDEPWNIGTILLHMILLKCDTALYKLILERCLMTLKGMDIRLHKKHTLLMHIKLEIKAKIKRNKKRRDTFNNG